MSPNNNLKIIQTTSDADFAICAKMMMENDPWIRLGMDYAYCLKAFDGGFKEIFVVKKENEIIGFVVMQTQGTFKGYIQTICIDKANRGGGYGTQLLRFCEDRILQYSPNIFICVSSFNEGAIKLYYKFGFELVGELKDFVKKGSMELLLRKTVGGIADYQLPSAKS
jgi:[ribosomal protein S18]-alanine N-acetyltransferase